MSSLMPFGCFPFQQLCTIAGSDSTDEINSTAELTNWLSKCLQPVLPPHVRPNLLMLVASGHSRGVKAAFALSLGKSYSPLLWFSALIGVDPVDGIDLRPVVIRHRNSDDGRGIRPWRGEEEPVFPACAPKGVNHKGFFCECRAPAYFFVAKDYGHFDLLDDDTNGVQGKVTYCLCKNGARREPTRRFVGGVVLEFPKAFLGGDHRDLIAIRDGNAKAPLEVQRVEIF